MPKLLRHAGGTLLAGFLLAAPLGAAPDGVAWEVADDPSGCASCHLGQPERPAADGLSIDGLPDAPEPGRRYRLSVRLTDPALRVAGFLLRVVAATETGAPGDPGMLDPVDERSETDGPRARSTWDGRKPTADGEARWDLDWIAPATVALPLRVELWGNVGNDDLSPLGDAIRHGIWLVPAGD